MPACFADSPSVSEVITKTGHTLHALEGLESYKLTYTITTTNFFKERGYPYERLVVTDTRRGSDHSVTVHIPRGSFREDSDLPASTIRRVFFRGAALDTNGFFTQVSPAPLVQHFQYRHYTDYQSLNVYKGLPKPAGNMGAFETTQPFIPEFLEKHRLHYSVHGPPENIDGVPCWRVEWPGMDVIWIDDEGLIRKRKVNWGEGLGVSVETHGTQFADLGYGLRMPRTIEATHYTNPFTESKKDWRKISYKLRVELVKSELNTATDKDFIVTPPPGSIVNDYIRRVQYRVQSSDEKPFEHAIAAANLDRPTRTPLVLQLSTVVLGLLVAMLLHRRIRVAKEVRAKR